MTRIESENSGHKCLSYLILKFFFKYRRELLQIMLSVVFFMVFGLPAVRRFLLCEVMVVKTRRNTEGIVAPTISLVSRDDTSLRGWRGPTKGFYDDPDCANLTNQPLESCIEEKTFSQEEVFADVLLGMEEKVSLMAEHLWREDFTMSWQGRFYTIQPDLKLTHFDRHRLVVALHRGFIHQVFIHDPNFFEVTYKPSFPGLLLTIYPNNSFNHFNSIVLTEVEEVDLTEDPCNTDPEYNFRACVSNSLSSRVGCRTKWDPWSHQDTPLCTTIEEYK